MITYGFRMMRRRKAPVSEEEREQEVLSSLCQLLRKNGDKILQGEGKLSLTTQSLGMLGTSMRRLSDTESMGLAASAATFNKINRQAAAWKQDVEFLRDFISKTLAIKLMHGSNTMQGAIQIHRFRSLTLLEVKKVPIHMIEGLQVLRGQLHTVIVSRSLMHLQELFETCGGDMSAPMSWPHLKSASVSFNGIQSLDGSLRLLPCLEEFDVSHNQLDRADKNLEYLTELQRLNLGYNCLSSLPTFSITCKAKLRTLVIKNNNLDNITGVEELTALQELDVSENCIADHQCLQALSSLLLMYRLNTVGNPIAYHREHRVLTTGCLSRQVLTTQFELDGKKLSASEISAARQRMQFVSSSRQPSSRRPSSLAHNVITQGSHFRDYTDSGEFSINESDGIATSVSVGPKKKGKRRNKRAREIADMDSSATEVSSLEGSYSSTKGGYFADHVNTRQTPLRCCVTTTAPTGSRPWAPTSVTQAAVASNSAASDSDTTSRVVNNNTSKKSSKDPTTSSSKDTSKDSMVTAMVTATTTSQPAVVSNGLSESVPTADDLYLNEPTQSVSLSRSPPDENSEMEKQNRHGGDHSRGSGLNNSEMVATVRQESSGFEWTRSEDEEIESYGEESEPFIVFLKQKSFEQMLVTLNQRYILEKNLNGAITERLDLKSLLSLDQSEDRVDHEDVMGNILMPHLQLTFDYVRKDRRERVYVMENEESAQKMCDFLQPFLYERELKSLPKFVYQCLKCCSTTSVVKKETSVQPKRPCLEWDPARSCFPEPGECDVPVPQVWDDHVIQVEKTVDSQPSSALSTPVGSYSSSSGSYLSPGRGQRSDSQGFVPSPLAKSTPRKPQISTNVGEQVQNVRRNLYSDNQQLDAAARPRSNAFVENTETPRTKSSSLESHIESVTTPIENKAFRRQSWSDMDHGLMNKVSYPRYASQDSDITILTNPSEGSIAVISESSCETLSALTPVEDKKSIQEVLVEEVSEKEEVRGNVFKEEVKGNVFKEEVMVRSASEPKQLHIPSEQTDVGFDKDITPMGSPLSNSICSSMVSSVYQNSGLDGTKEDSKSESSPSRVSEVVPGSDGTDTPSIYDSGIASSIGKDKRTSFHDKSDSASDINVIVTEGQDVELVEEVVEVVQTRERSHAVYEHPFTHVDHHLKLHLMMNVFDDNEEFECILKCDACQYLVEEEFRAILVMTATKFYVFKVAADTSSETVSDWLTTVDIQPVTELQYVDMGLGCQCFRMEFDTECSCYTFMMRDADQCNSFVTFLSELLQKNVLSMHNKIKAEFQLKPAKSTMADILREVLSRKSEEEALELYLMGYMVRGRNPSYPVSFVLSNRSVCLVKESHQWPQPRLQAPLAADSVAKHFTVLERQPINNIATVEIVEMDKRQMRLSFFNEHTGLETKWQITMETTNGVQSLVNGIRQPWEEEFGVELDVTMVPFTDSENEED
ncbi:LOW QUALITY PROTEIN: serine/threonine-protein kinase 11-interacting protein-like [Haliotis rubra]|uniref:LOW QUALITY PROTEIN: serine/threonine-protein kinase 11-interacting protein-like n=1 Tax=Haliotis rubra TaxID=36100 RepID=UPI001EE54E6B|nr:LOW QUALITY PROTEIN: serine/threonine-protein kinase 11-interacting protein-like [Haliotis rubra]